MNEWYPYRFKTKDEFLKEFGPDWHGKVYWNPYGGMDYLFGTVYPFNIKENTDECYLPYIETTRRANGLKHWMVFWNMLTKNEIKVPNYKPKKIERIYE